MSKEEREHCEARPFLRSFRVYNIDQTNMKEVNKEKYEKLVAQFQSPKVTDTQGMYKNAALDRMFEYQEWLCKIHCAKPSDRAFFSPTHDFIVIPQKEQFKIGKTESDIYKDGMEYYSTALHEMTHSTGTAERLNRNMEGRYGDPKYAKEELVAELSAAMVGNSMGFDKRITDNNAAYIDSWLHTLREEPRFIMSVMSDVNKASHLILEKIDEQKLALGEKPILNISRSDSEKSSITAGIYKQPAGNYVVRASVDGQELEPKPIDNKTAITYLKINDNSQKDKMLSDIVKKHYGEELSMPRVSQHVSQGLKI